MEENKLYAGSEGGTTYKIIGLCPFESIVTILNRDKQQKCKTGHNTPTHYMRKCLKGYLTIQEKQRLMHAWLYQTKAEKHNFESSQGKQKRHQHYMQFARKIRQFYLDWRYVIKEENSRNCNTQL